MQSSSNDSSRFSPVVIPESPGSKASQSKCLTGNPRLIRDLVAKVYDSIQQWNTIHLNGVTLLKTITHMKVDDSYPKELKNPCEELEKVCDQADQVVENLKQLTTQMKLVAAWHETENLFLTWPVEKFGRTAESIYEVYKDEAAVKRIILENVAHGCSDSWKMLHLAAWVYQAQIPDSTTIALESMLVETGLR